tara:strand:+ start:20 stop:277 length:258 start_codon:yes stop_codon:yes gene_type:complete
MKDLYIKNCFEFICPEKWENLERSDNESLRFCGSCDKQVFKANSLEELEKFSKENKCVAYKGDNSSPGIMGETAYPIFFNDIELD